MPHIREFIGCVLQLQVLEVFTIMKTHSHWGWFIEK